MGFAVHKIVGTNALEDLGFHIVDRSGAKQMLNNLENRYKAKFYSKLIQSQQLRIMQKSARQFIPYVTITSKCTTTK